MLEFLLEEFPDLFSVTTNTLTNITPIIIPMEGTSGPTAPYLSSINVSGLTGTVQKVAVTFKNLSHTFSADIGAILVGPNGHDTILMSTAGSGFYGIFDMYPSPAPTPSGNTQLSVYDYTNPNGTCFI